MSMLAFIVLHIPYTIQESGKIEASQDGTEDAYATVNHINSLYGGHYDNDGVSDDKRSMLFRYGKRPSLLRFGKRSSLFRFGKRLTDFDQEDEFDISTFSPIVSGGLFPISSDPRDVVDNSNYKRSSLFRFGKKSIDSNPMYDRNTDKYRKPHTPWRFGREELEELLGQKLPLNSIKLIKQ